MKQLSASSFRLMVNLGASELLAHRQEVNDLNVFPVADGDTGNNMLACVQGGISNMKDESTLSESANDLAVGSLFAAKGNSGVIFSQFIAGLSQGLSGIETADVASFHAAMGEGVKRAYQVVVHPVEGTMLTVLREAVESMAQVRDLDSFEVYFEFLLEAMRLSLRHTPELLPVLKAAGVIDSGGAGVLYFFQGMAKVLGVKEEDFPESFQKPILHEPNPEEGFCTEFIFQKKPQISFDLQEFRLQLEGFGGSIVCFEEGDLVKAHIHTKVPAVVADFARNYGSLITFKADDMAEQAKRRMEAEEVSEELAPIGALVVVPNQEIGKVFTDYGASSLLVSGEAMSPSMGEFLAAMTQAKCEALIVLPNNGNEVLVAQEAAKMVKGKPVYVLPTKSIGEGLGAISIMDLSCFDLEDNLTRGGEAIKSVFSLEIGQAVKDFAFDNQKAHQGDYVGFVHGDPVSAGPDLIKLFTDILLDNPDFEDKEVLTYFYGKDIEEAQVAEIEEILTQKNSFLEIYAIAGNQTTYPIIACFD